MALAPETAISPEEAWMQRGAASASTPPEQSAVPLADTQPIADAPSAPTEAQPVLSPEDAWMQRSKVATAPSSNTAPTVAPQPSILKNIGYGALAGAADTLALPAHAAMAGLHALGIAKDRNMPMVHDVIAQQHPDVETTSLPFRAAEGASAGVTGAAMLAPAARGAQLGLRGAVAGGSKLASLGSKFAGTLADVGPQAMADNALGGAAANVVETSPNAPKSGWQRMLLSLAAGGTGGALGSMGYRAAANALPKAAQFVRNPVEAMAGGPREIFNGVSMPSQDVDTVANMMREHTPPDVQSASDLGIMPEPQHDIDAQANAVRDPSSAKDSMLVTQPDAAPSDVSGLQSVKTPHGMFYSTNADKIAAAGADNLSQDDMGKLLGYVTPSDARGGAQDTVVQALDKNGNVVHEEVTTPEHQAAALANAQTMMPAGGRVNTTDVTSSLARRMQGLVPGSNVTNAAMQRYLSSLHSADGAPDAALSARWSALEGAAANIDPDMVNTIDQQNSRAAARVLDQQVANAPQVSDDTLLNAPGRVAQQREDALRSQQAAQLEKPVAEQQQRLADLDSNTPAKQDIGTSTRDAVTSKLAEDKQDASAKTQAALDAMGDEKVPTSHIHATVQELMQPEGYAPTLSNSVLEILKKIRTVLPQNASAQDISNVQSDLNGLSSMHATAARTGGELTKNTKADLDAIRTVHTAINDAMVGKTNAVMDDYFRRSAVGKEAYVVGRDNINNGVVGTEDASHVPDDVMARIRADTTPANGVGAERTNALREAKSQYGDAMTSSRESVGKLATNSRISDESIASRVLGPSDSAAGMFRDLKERIGAERANTLLMQEAKRQLFDKGVLDSEGKVNLTKYGLETTKRIFARLEHEGVTSDDLSKITSAKQAQEHIDALLAEHAKQLKELQSQKAQQFLGRPADEVWNEITTGTPDTKMRRAMNAVIDKMHDDPQAMKALQRLEAERIVDKYIQLGNGGVRVVDKRGLEKYLSAMSGARGAGDKSPLTRLFTGQGTVSLRNLLSHLKSLEDATARGKPSTDELTSAAHSGTDIGKDVAEKSSMLQAFIETGKDISGMGHIVTPLMIGARKVASKIINHVIGDTVRAMKSADINNRKQLIAAAIMDPGVRAALQRRVVKNHVSVLDMKNLTAAITRSLVNDTVNIPQRRRAKEIAR